MRLCEAHRGFIKGLCKAPRCFTKFQYRGNLAKFLEASYTHISVFSPSDMGDALLSPHKGDYVKPLGRGGFERLHVAPILSGIHEATMQRELCKALYKN